MSLNGLSHCWSDSHGVACQFSRTLLNACSRKAENCHAAYHSRSDFQLLIYPSGNLATSFQTTDDPVWNALYMRDLRANLEEWPNDYESLIELSISDGETVDYNSTVLGAIAAQDASFSRVQRS